MKRHQFCAAFAGAAIAFGWMPNVGAAEKTVLVVLAASSTRSVMIEMAAAFEKTHPDVVVQTSFAGSKVIAAQVQQGAAVDVVLISDTVVSDLGGTLTGVTPIDRNHTAIVVSTAAAAKIHGPADLVKSGIRLGGGTPGSVIARTGAQTVAKIAKRLGGDYAAKFAANVTTTKTDNGKLAATIEDGSVDAAILYSSDAVPGKTVLIELPESDRMYETHDAAVATASTHQGAAREYMALLASAEGAAIFRRHHHDAVH
jgi:molybdate transport system substrate-binding protein